MNALLRTSALLLVLVTFVTVAHGQATEWSAAPLSWQGFEEAFDEAETSKKKVLVDVYAPWCGYCRKMHEEVYPDPEIREYIEANFELTRVDIDVDTDTLTYRGGYKLSSRMLATLFQTSGTPNTVFLMPDGNFITALPGFAPREQFMTVLKYIASDAYQTQPFQAFMEAENGTEGTN